VVTDPATGAAVCRSVLDGSDPGCVPYNLWALGGITDAALGYVQLPAFQSGSTSQDILGAIASADLGHYGIRLPWVSAGVETAVGFERRRERLERQADSAFASGDLTGAGSAQPDLGGSYVVKEIFGELRVPVLESLRFNGSYRYSDYDTGQATDTFGIGFDFQPLREARLRGSFQRAIRAANISELFEPRVRGGWEFKDPCEGAAPQRSLADCARTGVTAQQYGFIPESPFEFSPVDTIEGGNPRLAPETAKTATLGIVFTPARNLSASLDYWRIALEDAIAIATPNTIFDLCIDTGNPTFCERIHRDPSFGAMWFPPSEIDNTLMNLSKWRTSGYDVSLAYSHRFAEAGSLTIDALGTYVREFVRETFAGSGEFDCAGYYADACERPTPKWRHRVRATWATPWNVELSATWRYMGEVKHAGTSSNPLLAYPADDPVHEVNRVLGDRSYLDLALLWAIDKRLQLRVGVANVLDRDPPVSAAGAAVPQYSGNSVPQSYDVLGRRVWVNLAATF
jgi:outer membrane receptor protein involved in Fe transport